MKHQPQVALEFRNLPLNEGGGDRQVARGRERADRVPPNYRPCGSREVAPPVVQRCVRLLGVEHVKLEAGRFRVALHPASHGRPARPPRQHRQLRRLTEGCRLQSYTEMPHHPGSDRFRFTELHRRIDLATVHTAPVVDDEQLRGQPLVQNKPNKHPRRVRIETVVHEVRDRRLEPVIEPDGLEYPGVRGNIATGDGVEGPQDVGQSAALLVRFARSFTSVWAPSVYRRPLRPAGSSDRIARTAGRAATPRGPARRADVRSPSASRRSRPRSAIPRRVALQDSERIEQVIPQRRRAARCRPTEDRSPSRTPTDGPATSPLHRLYEAFAFCGQWSKFVQGLRPDRRSREHTRPRGDRFWSPHCVWPSHRPYGAHGRGAPTRRYQRLRSAPPS